MILSIFENLVKTMNKDILKLKFGKTEKTRPLGQSLVILCVCKT